MLLMYGGNQIGCCVHSKAKELHLTVHGLWYRQVGIVHGAKGDGPDSGNIKTGLSGVLTLGTF